MEQVRDKPEHPISHMVHSVHRKYEAVESGKVATYIPELAKADPRSFGVCIATVKGDIFAAGDCDRQFTIQSISKPFVFGMALEHRGRSETLKRVGVEPSGDAFNSIVLDQKTMRPFNPMVNAGAIATTGLIGGASREDRFARILDRFSRAAGRQLAVDEAVYESEAKTGNRNRAIAYLMLNFGMVDDRVEEILDLYFRQCSILVNCRDLAMMSATLANMGVNPVTGEEAFDANYITDVLAVMFTCGMYDRSGEWAYRVGVPAKSGVAGGVLAVVNRQLGIGVYSPRLDEQGNSVRGIRVCVDLAEELGLHIFDIMNPGSAFLKSVV